MVLLSSYALWAQPQVVGLPLQWAQYPQALPLINPASAGAEGKLEVNIGNQRALGLWRNNQSYYANANVRLLRKSQPSMQFHVLGAAFTTEKEGRYLQRSRAYVLYGFHLRLQKSWMLSSGTSLGFANFVVSPNEFNGGGAAMAPDGHIGVWLRSSKYALGLGHHQIFQGKLSPIWETTLLKRYWSVTGSGLWALGPWFDLRLGTLCRLVPETRIDLDINANLIIQQILSTGATYRHERGLAFAIGLERIKIGSSVFKGMFSYQIPLFKYAAPNIQGVEITLKYLINVQDDSDDEAEK